MSEGKVVNLGIAVGDASRVTVEQCLEGALEEVRAGEIRPTKVLVLLLDDRDGSYDLRYRQAQAKSSELIALADIFKTVMKKAMGFSD